MPIRLMETAIAKAAREAAESGRRKDLADGGCPGLRLRLTPAGAKSWALACRDREGRMRRFLLGTFPTMGISEARTEARSLHARVKQEGADPTADRRRQRAMGNAAKAGVGTLKAILDLYGETVGNHQKAWGGARQRIDLIWKPLLPRPSEVLQRRDLQMLADAYKSQSSAAFAVRSFRPVLKWAARRGYVPEDLTRIVPPVPVGRRQRVLSRDELAAVLPALRASNRPYAAAMLFMLFTLARRQEASSATWGAIDMEAGTWTIAETKNAQPHVVPLSHQALDLLRERRPETPKAGELVFRTKGGGALINWDRETKEIQEKSRTAGWTRHDLRRTAATMLGEMGDPPDIIEAALNHAGIHSQLAATYDRARYRPQVAAALQRLADALDGIEASAAQVVLLRSARV
jgi:integrase